MSPRTRRLQTRLHRTTIDIDLDTFGEAREALGTSGYKDTVNAALREVAGRKTLLEFADEIRAGSIPGPAPEELAETRSPRVF